MADRQAVPPSDGDLDEPPGGGSPTAGSMGAQGAQDAFPPPPPPWDGQTPFEDYHIKAQLWFATTKDKAKSRGPLLLKILTGAPFELYKHWAKDPAWL